MGEEDAVGKIWTITAPDNGSHSHAFTPANQYFTERGLSAGAIQSPYYVGVQSRFRRKNFHKVLYIILIAIIVLLLISTIILAYYVHHPKKTCKTSDCVRSAANLLQTMDLSIDPCDDFYAFSCGNWHREHPRPDSSASYDWFAEKQDFVLRNIREMLTSNDTANVTLPLPVSQTKLMYAACMNTDTLEELSLSPVVKYLAAYDIPLIPTYLNLTDANEVEQDTKFDWITSVAKIKRAFGADLMIGFDIFPDPVNQTQYSIAVGSPESSTLLPFNTEMDKYYNTLKKKAMSGDTSDDRNESWAAYSLYIAEIISNVISYVDPTIRVDMYEKDFLKTAKTIVSFAKTIFQMSTDAENATQPDKANILTDIISITTTDLQNVTDSHVAPQASKINWTKYMTTIFEDVPTFNINSDTLLTSKSDLQYLKMLSEFLLNSTAEEIELYIWWSIVEDLVVHTTKAMRELQYQYASSVSEVEGSVSRSLYCTSGVNQLMGMAVAYFIVDTKFEHETKPRVAKMLRNIQYSFNNFISQIDWMDGVTKRMTLEKSEAMKSFIGFPDWLLNNSSLEEYYQGITITNLTHLDNMMDLLRVQMTNTLRSVHEENKFEWATAPTNVNAFHTFQANAITIPLAILQYPFYNLGLESLNYGSLGTILGHELTHGFDDSGRQYDKDGNMRQWWTNATVNEYVNRTKCFINQYSKYTIPEIGHHINGELTLGENIADNGGLREAFHAYQKYVKDAGTAEPQLPGLERFTHNQLLFISFGNLWCETATAESSRWALEDSHCPGKIRLKGVLHNSVEFTETFQCPRGTGMNPLNVKCRIW